MREETRVGNSNIAVEDSHPPIPHFLPNRHKQKKKIILKLNATAIHVNEEPNITAHLLPRACGILHTHNQVPLPTKETRVLLPLVLTLLKCIIAVIYCTINLLGLILNFSVG